MNKKNSLRLRKILFNLPNLMSLLRLVLAPAIGHFLFWGNTNLALFLIFIAYSLDVLDGFYARKFNLETEFGKIIDPIADKVMYAFIAIALLLNGLLPLWFFVIYVFRDMVILIGSYAFSKAIKEIPKANFLGKISAFAVAMTLVGVIFKLPYIDPWALIFALILSYWSTLIYFLKGYKYIQTKKTTI